MAAAKTREQSGPCRCSSKLAMQSEEDLAVMKQDLAFLDVVQNAELSEVERLIKEGQEVNVGDENGNSACHKALEAGTKSMTVIQLLVQNGAFIDYNNAYDERPIHMAIKKGELARSTLEYLIGLKDQAGKRVVDLMAVDRVKGNTLLHEAAWHGNEFACTCLLQTGAFNDKLETCNKQGQTVMQCVFDGSEPRRSCNKGCKRSPCQHEQGDSTPPHIRCMRHAACGSTLMVLCPCDASSRPLHPGTSLPRSEYRLVWLPRVPAHAVWQRSALRKNLWRCLLLRVPTRTRWSTTRAESRERLQWRWHRPWGATTLLSTYESSRRARPSS